MPIGKPLRDGATVRRVEAVDGLHDMGATLAPVAQHGDRRIGRNRVLECVYVVHHHHGVHRVLGSDKSSKPLAVLVVHPAVCTDERKPSLGAEHRQALLEEADIDISPAPHRRALGSIGSTHFGRNVLEPHIGRVPDHEVGLQGTVAPAVAEQEVPSGHPLGTEALRDVDWLAELDKPGGHRLASGVDVAVKHIERPDGLAHIGEGPAIPRTGLRQPLNDRPQEGPGAARRLHDHRSPQVVSSPVASQVQNQIDHPAAREHLTVRSVRIDGPSRHRAGSLHQLRLTVPGHRHHPVPLKLHKCHFTDGHPKDAM